MGHARLGGIHVTNERRLGISRFAACATGTWGGPATVSVRTCTARAAGARLLCGRLRWTARVTETVEQTRRGSACADGPGNRIGRTAACLRAGDLPACGGIHPLGGGPPAREQGAGYR